MLSHAVLKLIGAMVGPDFEWSTGDPTRGIKQHIAFPLFKAVNDISVPDMKQSIYGQITETDADR